jgi:hypothetical protein
MKTLAISLISFLIFGCASFAPRTNPYDGLLPKNYQLKPAQTLENQATLKTRTIGLVAGANFEQYTAVIAKDTERVKALQNSPLGFLDSRADRQYRDNLTDDVSPTRMTLYFGKLLVNNFKTVQIYSDIASARAAKVDYIAMLDFSFQHIDSSNGLFYSQIDILNAKLEQVLSVKSEVQHAQAKANISGFDSSAQAGMKMNLLRSADIKKCLEQLGSSFTLALNKQ